MDYALVPGHVYLSVPPKEPPKILPEPAPKLAPEPAASTFLEIATLWLLTALSSLWSLTPLGGASAKPVDEPVMAQPSTLTGINLLATCKQVYEEGHLLFYGLNTFCLPAGSWVEVHRWCFDLQPIHRFMIKTVRLTLTLADRPPQVSDKMDAAPDWDHYMAGDVLRPLVIIWWEKVEYVKRWSTIETILINTGGAGVFVIDPRGAEEPVPPPERAYMVSARQNALRVLEEAVHEIGFAATKTWLREGAEMEWQEEVLGA